MFYKTSGRRKYRKNYKKKKMYKRPKDIIYRFRRTETTNSVPILGSAGSLMYGVISPSLAALPSPTEFLSLFDAYRITGVKLTFVFNTNYAPVGTAGTYPAAIPVIGFCYDYDDGTVPTSTGQIYQYQNFKIRRLDKVFSVYFKPRPLITGALAVSGSGYYSISNKTWISNASPNVEYFSLKYFINTSGIATNNVAGMLNIYAKYYIECKNPL